MSHPFDEIREHSRKYKEEEAKQRQLEELAKQEQQSKLVNFTKQVNAYASVINATLEEFGIACWGDKEDVTPLKFDDTPAWFGRFQVMLSNKQYVTNALPPPTSAPSFKDQQDVTPLRLRLDGLTAIARAKDYFIKVNGDTEGNIIGVDIGTVRSETVGGGEDTDSVTVYYCDTQLHNPTKKDIEQALAKSWRKRLRTYL